MSANTVLVMFGAESCVCVDCNQVYKEGRVMKAVMSILVDNCIDFDGMERSILAKEICWDVGLVGFDSIDQEEKRPKLQRHLAGLPRGIMAPEVYKKVGGRWEAVVFTDMVSDGPMSHGKVCVLTESLHRVIESFIVSYRNWTYRIIATEFAYWRAQYSIDGGQFPSPNPLERKDAEKGEIRDDFDHVTNDASVLRGLNILVLLTSERDNSDKHGTIETPNGNNNTRVVISHSATNVLRKDYFPSDLQIWSYYGNVKEAILLHNALSRQTKDAGLSISSSWRGSRVDGRSCLLSGGSEANGIIRDPKLELESSRFTFDLVPLSYESVDVVVGENWLLRHKAEMVCHEKVVKMPCVPKELVGFTPRRRIGFRMELVQGATPICEGSCRLTSLERQEVWNDCRSCKVRVGSNGNLLWEASVLLGRKKGGVHGDDVAKTVFRMRNGHVEVYGYAFWVNQCTSGFHGVNEPGGVRVAREDDRGVTEGREDREVFQQRRSGAKRKLSRCGRNQIGNEPILALPEGADDFVVYYDARSKDLEACLEKKGEGDCLYVATTEVGRRSEAKNEFEIDVRRSDLEMESGSYWLDKVRTSIWRDVRTLAIEEAYTTKYSIHPGADTMLCSFRLTNQWLSMKKDIASCGSKYLAYSEVEVEYQGS
ncbi:hypothetical protein Tco_0286442 [Tanacetum coccineum]